MFALCFSGVAIALSLWNLWRIGGAMRRLRQQEAQLQAELCRARDLSVRK